MPVHRKRDIRAQRQMKEDGRTTVSFIPPLLDDGYRTLRFIIEDRSHENLNRCYARLDSSEVHSYFKKYRYHDSRQTVVMRGEVVFEKTPRNICGKLIDRLTEDNTGWILLS